MKPKRTIRRRDTRLFNSKISPSHLQAIGKVAANWSALETTVIISISDISNVHTFHVFVMAGPAAFASWLDMLLVEIGNSPHHALRIREFEDLSSLLLKLQRLRNCIVHATWESKDSGRGLVEAVMNPTVVRARDKVTGFGIPKRGRNVIVKVTWTAKKIRLVADLISEATTMLHEFVHLPRSTSAREQLAQLLLNQTSRARIREMLDSLPDPFHKLPKPRRRPQMKGA